MSTRVVHVNDNVPGAVYIGRAMPRRGLLDTGWGNPYTVGGHGRKAAIDAYERDARKALAGIARTAFIDELTNLAGKPLACWCRHDGEERTPDNACHGDVLMELIRDLGLEGGDA